MTEIREQIDDREILAAINRLLDRAVPGGMRSVFSSIGRYGKTSTQLRFRNQVGPDGERWRPSARAKRVSGQTLRDTGRLRNSISFVANRDGVEWGTNVVYGPTMHFGRAGPERVSSHPRLIKQAFGHKLRFGVWQTVKSHTRNQSIEGRPFLGVSDADRTEILAILAEDLIRSSQRRS